jgi:hypothetical protein
MGASGLGGSYRCRNPEKGTKKDSIPFTKHREELQPFKTIFILQP